MKLIAMVAVCLAAGIFIGFLLTKREFSQEQLPTRGLVKQTSTTSNPAAAPTVNQKLVVVGGAAYNFGEMDRHAEGSHEFVFRNDGPTPIGLKKGQTTCKCTMSEMKDGELMPGESLPIKLTWTAKTGETEFSQAAEIITANYPSQPVVRLHVYGKIIDALRIDRGSISMGSISTSENAVSRFKIYAFRGDDSLEITKHEFTQPENAELFSVSFRPLTTEEVAAEIGVKSGVEATLQIKPGLPLGTINQALRITTNLPSTSAMTAPIEGRVVGDIMVVGPGAQTEQNMIRFGDAKSAEGKSVRYHLVVKGSHRAETTLKIEDVRPADGLQAVLGEALTDNPQVTRYPLTITIPKGTKPVSLQGLKAGEAGVVRLSSTHPQIKEFVIIVRYAVTE